MNERWTIVRKGERRNGEAYEDTIELTPLETHEVLNVMREHVDKIEHKPGAHSVFKERTDKWIKLLCKIDV